MVGQLLRGVNFLKVIFEGKIQGKRKENDQERHKVNK